MITITRHCRTRLLTSLNQSRTSLNLDLLSIDGDFHLRLPGSRGRKGAALKLLTGGSRGDKVAGRGVKAPQEALPHHCSGCGGCGAREVGGLFLGAPGSLVKLSFGGLRGRAVAREVGTL